MPSFTYLLTLVCFIANPFPATSSRPLLPGQAHSFVPGMCLVLLPHPSVKVTTAMASCNNQSHAIPKERLMEHSVALCPLFLSSRLIVPVDSGFCGCSSMWKGIPTPRSLIIFTFHFLSPGRWPGPVTLGTGLRVLNLSGGSALCPLDSQCPACHLSPCLLVPVGLCRERPEPGADLRVL